MFKFVTLLQFLSRIADFKATPKKSILYVVLCTPPSLFFMLFSPLSSLCGSLFSSLRRSHSSLCSLPSLLHAVLSPSLLYVVPTLLHVPLSSPYCSTSPLFSTFFSSLTLLHVVLFPPPLLSTLFSPCPPLFSALFYLPSFLRVLLFANSSPHCSLSVPLSLFPALFYHPSFLHVLFVNSPRCSLSPLCVNKVATQFNLY